MTRKLKQLPLIWLTLSLVGFLLSWAFARELPDRFALGTLQYTSIILMLLSLKSLKKNRPWLIGWISILAITLLLVVAHSATENLYFGYAYLFLLLIFFISAAWLVGNEVLLTGSVDINKIVGSVALYFLLGLIWSIMYTILLGFSPEAMRGVEPGTWNDHLFIMSYFSFVTLTTLGYGDISPLTPIAQVLVILEAITGMFYLAVIVASLIGSNRHRSAQP